MSKLFFRSKEKTPVHDIEETDIENDEYRTRIELLYEIAQEASSASDVSKLLERILQVSRQSLKASAAMLTIINDINEGGYCHVANGTARAHLHQVKLESDSDIAGWVARNATPLMINDVTADDRFNNNIDNITGFVTKSIIAVPLSRGHKVIGVLEVINKKDDRDFDDRDMQVLKGFASTEALLILASMALTAIENISSLSLEHALLDGYRSIAEAWAMDADSRDKYAYAHSKRVRDYALLAANRLSLSPKELRDIEFGALFHDIGKIGIDSRILCKPGPLAEKEWRIIQEHCEKGEKIISNIDFLEKAKDIVLYHHEKFNGEGYPEGLKGEAIPIGARLVAVADAFDTMTTDHSYRPAMNTEEAINELIAGIGTQFCPEAVEAFIAAIRKRDIDLIRQEIDEITSELPFIDTEVRPTEAAEIDEPDAREPYRESDDEIFAPKDPGTDETEIQETCRESEEDISGFEEPDLDEPEIQEPCPECNIEAEPQLEAEEISHEIFKGNVRLVVPLTVGFSEVRRFKKHLEKIENLKVLMTGGSEEEGHIILISLETPMELLWIIHEINIVEQVEKQGKQVIVALKNLSN